MPSTSSTCAAALAALFAIAPVAAQRKSGAGKVKVFVLAGQSNMQGHGRISMGKDGDLDYAARQEQFAYLKQDGDWVERDDVWYMHTNGKGATTKGKLKVGLGANARSIGPELAFGHVLGAHFDEPVLLIKTAWGGQALGMTFRPPSSKLPPREQLEQLRDKANKKKGRKAETTVADIEANVGSRYRQVIEEVEAVLTHLPEHFPEARGKGYELAGFFWHQGWNDGCSKQYSAEYEQNMSNFIRDMRKDLGDERLPFVIATSGMGGPGATGVAGWLGKSIEPQQIAAASKFARCVAVPTRAFQKHKPGRQKSHWHNSAESYCLVGDAAARAMIEILER